MKPSFRKKVIQRLIQNYNEDTCVDDSFRFCEGCPYSDKKYICKLNFHKHAPDKKIILKELKKLHAEKELFDVLL